MATATTATTSVLDLARIRALAESGRAREIRLAARLSLHDIASAVGTTPSTIQRWESKGRRPHDDAALRWLALLDALERQAVAA